MKSVYVLNRNGKNFVASSSNIFKQTRVNLTAELEFKIISYLFLIMKIANPKSNNHIKQAHDMTKKHTLNARRLLCPMPVIRTQDAVKKLRVGDILEIIGTDSGVLQDIPTWCRINGHIVLESFSSDYDYHIILQVGR